MRITSRETRLSRRHTNRIIHKCLIEGHALDHSEEDFIRTVTNGKKKKMPSFKEKLNEAEIKEVVDYVRNVIQAEARKKGKKSGSHQH